MQRLFTISLLCSLALVGCPTADPLGPGSEQDQVSPVGDLDAAVDPGAPDLPDDGADDDGIGGDTGVDDPEDLDAGREDDGQQLDLDGDVTDSATDVPEDLGGDMATDPDLDDEDAQDLSDDSPTDGDDSTDLPADTPLDAPDGDDLTTDPSSDSPTDTGTDTATDTGTDIGDDTCEPDCSDTVDDPPECTTGPCCEGGHYRNAEERCDDTPHSARFACEGVGCGADARRQFQYRNCTGSSADCGTDNLRWEGWETIDICEPDEACVIDVVSECVECEFGCSEGSCNPDSCDGVVCNTPNDDYCVEADKLLDYEDLGECIGSACVYDFIERYCDTGCQSRPGEPDICNPECRPADTCCNDAGEYRLESERCGLTPLDTRYSCESDACGADGLRERQFQFCTGTDASCGGSNLKWIADTYNACTDAQLCQASAGDASCHTCDYGCSGSECTECTLDDHCGDAYWCNGGTCEPCNVDEHCGDECTNCDDTDAECSDDGTHCIECERSFPDCTPGGWCNDGQCDPCNVSDHCGLIVCLPCWDELPECHGLLRICVCNDTSCDPNYECDGFGCVVCARDDACAADCVACKDPDPRCVDRGSWSECVECLSNDDCDGALVCNTANECVDAANCDVPPAEACSNGGQSAESCPDALVVSRTSAAGGTTRSGDLDDAHDNDERCSGSNGEDRFFRIFMFEGESLSVTMDIDSSYGFDAVLALFYSAAPCDGGGCDVEARCVDSGDKGSDESFSGYVAPQSGWYIIKIDAWTWIDSEEYGDYDLDISLTCSTGDCGC